MMYETKNLIETHSNYRYLLMTEMELRNDLVKWSREDLINWLKWNDPNGIYEDKHSIKELGNILSFEEGVELIVKQSIQR